MNMEITPGMRFGRLTVVSELPERYHKQIVWRCACDCGNATDVPSHNLRSGRVRSCGCLRREHTASMQAGRALGVARKTALRVDGTAIDSILSTRKLNRNNRTGVRGVSILPDGRFRAGIMLRHVRHELGVFDTLAAAAAARREAEKTMYDPILKGAVPSEKDH
ncbi:MAG: hypothetical protein VB104_07950 [Candidatus Limiplasma sp.]|nr:hypothetical protein [Candidatus Limiplasma sp.]